MNPVPRKGHGYTGTHTPLPDGLCRHRWANRLTRVVGGCPVAALATYRAGLRERVAGLPYRATIHGETFDRERVLALLDAE